MEVVMMLALQYSSKLFNAARPLPRQGPTTSWKNARQTIVDYVPDKRSAIRDLVSVCKKVVVLDSRVADDRGSCFSVVFFRVLELATGRSPVAHCVRPEDDGLKRSSSSTAA